jgi:hypothetical protein
MMRVFAKTIVSIVELGAQFTARGAVHPMQAMLNYAVGVLTARMTQWSGSSLRAFLGAGLTGFAAGFAFSDLERELIRARTGEGRERAVANGVRLGRKPTLTHHQQLEAIKRLKAGKETHGEIALSYNSAGGRYRGSPRAIVGEYATRFRLLGPRAHNIRQAIINDDRPPGQAGAKASPNADFRMFLQIMRNGGV